VFCLGSQDLMTGMNGYCERRPGFANAVESVPTPFNNLQRLFTWDRFDGTFIEMACDINASNQAVVYKRVIGIDNSFVAILTDTTNNAMAFDFVVSNNTVYFSNGNLAKKWDPVNGVSNWGLSIGLMNSSVGPNPVGTSGGNDVSYAGGTAWSSPGNIVGAADSSYATVALTQPASQTSTGLTSPSSMVGGSGWSGTSYTYNSGAGGGSTTTSALVATSYGFSIPSTATINGIQVQITRNGGPPIDSNNASDNTVQLLKSGSATGSNKAVAGFWPNTSGSQTYGGSGDLWGTSWTPGDINNNANFGVELIVNLHARDPYDTAAANVSNMQITVWYTPSGPPGPTLNSDYLQGTIFSMGVPSTNTVSGIQVEIDGYQSVPPSGGYSATINVQLLKAGNLAGSAKTGQSLPTSAGGSITLGGPSDLWGTNWLPNDVDQTNFGVSIQAISTLSTVQYFIDAIKVTVYGVGGPSAGVTSGSLTAATGYQYVFCFGNSASGHVSSPTLPSNVVKPSSQNMTLQLIGSSESQVTQIRVFRSTDSVAAGTTAGVYYELPTSPYPNISVVSTSSTSSVLTVTTTTNLLSPTQPYGNHQLTAGQTVVLNGTQESFLNGQPLTVLSSGLTATQFKANFSHANYSNSNDTGTVGQLITDSAADTALNVNSIAPTAGYNDPPPPLRRPVYFSGRIWGFRNSSQGNQVFFSALEECVNGVPEESFPSGAAGNYWNFDEPVQALAVAGSAANQMLLVFCGGRIYSITGNSLDTFRKTLVSSRRGCRNLIAASSMSGIVGWLDSAGQVWTTDGSSLQEVSVPIRLDLVNIIPASCSLTFHSAGKFHWLVLSTGSQLFVYDLDLQQWMPPWSFACNYIYSGETAAGSYQLMAATSVRALMLSTTAHNDNGNTYTPIAKTNLFAVVPDFSQNPNASMLGIYDQPSKTGYPAIIEIDTNNVMLADVLFVSDDDPTNAASVYTSVFANQKDPSIAYNRQNGANLRQNIFPMTQPNARWIGLQIKGLKADDNLKIYEWFMAYKELRTFGRDGM